MKSKIKDLIPILILLSSCNVSTSSYKEGKYIYEKNCASCHGIDAEGLGDWYPSLYDKNYIISNRNKLASWIRYGISMDSNAIYKSRFHQVDMPENKLIQDVEICNILNYLNEKYWHNSPFEIAEIRATLNLKNKLQY